MHAHIASLQISIHLKTHSLHATINAVRIEQQDSNLLQYITLLTAIKQAQDCAKILMTFDTPVTH